jgi:hypothetical protein
MKNYPINYLSEFEHEFELDSESSDSYNEFETVNDEFESEGDFETENEFDSEGDFESNDENNYLSEFENDNEYEVENEFENTPEGQFEARLYELFTNNYESDFEFENDFNEVMHEMERDYFWGGLRKLAKKGLSMGLKALPIDDKWKKMIGGLAQGKLPDLRSLIKTLGPKLAQFIPGIGPIASTALGAMMNSETSTQNQAKQAAQSTVALAKQTYTNFANGLVNNVAPSNNVNQVKNQIQNVAQNAIKNAHNSVRLGSKKSHYRRVSRKIQDVMIRGKRYKKVTILYEKIR